MTQLWETVPLILKYSCIRNEARLAFSSSNKLIFAKCDGSKPDGTAAGSLNLTVSGKGVTYKEDAWNTMSITVNANGKITISVNGVQVYEDTTTGYIDGYVGLYAYVAGVQFRNFKLVEDFSVVSDDEDSDGHAQPNSHAERILHAVRVGQIDHQRGHRPHQRVL